jgi:hypothetical protein
LTRTSTRRFIRFQFHHPDDTSHTHPPSVSPFFRIQPVSILFYNLQIYFRIKINGNIVALRQVFRWQWRS